MASKMASSPTLLFVIVGRNEPLFETEFNPRRGGGNASAADSVSRQNYFVLHSALDLVERAAWTTPHMYLKVVDKVCSCEFVSYFPKVYRDD
jgi:trafficking protein particle complex subunit 2